MTCVTCVFVQVCAGMEEAGWQVLKPASLDELVIDTCPDIHLP